jgi:hypothetical protein
LYSCGMTVNFLNSISISMIPAAGIQDSSSRLPGSRFPVLPLCLRSCTFPWRSFPFSFLFGKGIAVTAAFAWNYLGQSRITFRPWEDQVHDQSRKSYP